MAASGGGVKSYIDGLLATLPEMYGDRLITSFEGLDQSQYHLLHIHEGEMLKHFHNSCPAVYTLHNHDLYCPSGTKYLARQGVSCDRQMSVIGCTWGHLVDGCGSRRPNQIINNFNRAYSSYRAIQSLGITVIANSDYVRSQLIFNGIPPKQVVTLRCGIASPRSQHHHLTAEIHAQQRILFAGRIVPDKGLEFLLKTLPMVASSVQLDVAGEGWDLARMKNLAKTLKLDDRITWHGWCSGEKLEDLYRQSLSVVFPSLWPEPAGLITLESYARFRAVIATQVGGIPEHIRDRQTGILVKPNDPNDLATAINSLAKDFHKAREIGIAGNKLFLEEFTLPIHAAKLREIYEQAIAKFNQV